MCTHATGVTEVARALDPPFDDALCAATSTTSAHRRHEMYCTHACAVKAGMEKLMPGLNPKMRSSIP